MLEDMELVVLVILLYNLDHMLLVGVVVLVVLELQWLTVQRLLEMVDLHI